MRMNQSLQENVSGGTDLNTLIHKLQLMHFLLHFVQIRWMLDFPLYDGFQLQGTPEVVSVLLRYG